MGGSRDGAWRGGQIRIEACNGQATSKPSPRKGLRRACGKKAKSWSSEVARDSESVDLEEGVFA